MKLNYFNFANLNLTIPNFYVRILVYLAFLFVEFLIENTITPLFPIYCK